MTISKKTPTLESAMEYFNKGSLGRAESTCRRIIRKDRESTGAYFLLGLIHHERGAPDAAMEAYRKVLSINPEVPEAHYNLAEVLKSLGQDKSAMKHLEEAVRQRPNWIEAHNNLGVCYLDQGEHEQAFRVFQHLVETDPNHPTAWLNLGNAILKKETPEQVAKSIDIFRRAVELNPDVGQAHHNLGIVLEAAGDEVAAVRALHTAVELEPEQEMWKFYLDVRSGEERIDAIPEDYVADLFDAYADKFDEHLVGRLEYRVPELIHAAVQECEIDPPLDLLDLGCGTGLCGELFHPITQSIIGIDLSPRMIEVARSKGVYSDCEVVEINSYLQNRDQEFDVILAADVFLYMGDLQKTFELAQRALRPHGLLAFSVETHEGDGFVLGSNRRFRHSERYLRQLAETCHLSIRLANPATLRKQAGTDVAGVIVVLGKDCTNVV